MGLDPEPGSIEEQFMILTLRRQRLGSFYKDLALIKASIGDKEGSIECFKSYSEIILPEIGVASQEKEEEMFTMFDKFKGVKFEMSKDVNNDRLMMRLG